MCGTVQVRPEPRMDNRERTKRRRKKRNAEKDEIGELGGEPFNKLKMDIRRNS